MSVRLVVQYHCNRLLNACYSILESGFQLQIWWGNIIVLAVREVTLCYWCSFAGVCLPRGPVQRHDVWLPLHGAVSLPRSRHQRAAGGRGSDRQGRLCRSGLDRRWPGVGPQGESDQSGQALPGRPGAALVRSRPRPGTLPGDESPSGEQDPPAKVPFLPRPQRTVMHMQIYEPICTHTPGEWARGRREKKHTNNSPAKCSSIYIFCFNWKRKRWCLVKWRGRGLIKHLRITDYVETTSSLTHPCCYLVISMQSRWSTTRPCRFYSYVISDWLTHLSGQ